MVEDTRLQSNAVCDSLALASSLVWLASHANRIRNTAADARFQSRRLFGARSGSLSQRTQGVAPERLEPKRWQMPGANPYTSLDVSALLLRLAWPSLAGKQQAADTTTRRHEPKWWQIQVSNRDTVLDVRSLLLSSAWLRLAGEPRTQKL